MDVGKKNIVSTPISMQIDSLGRAENKRNNLKYGVCGKTELVIFGFRFITSLKLPTEVGKLSFHQPSQKTEEKHRQKQDN